MNNNSLSTIGSLNDRCDLSIGGTATRTPTECWNMNIRLAVIVAAAGTMRPARGKMLDRLPIESASHATMALELFENNAAVAYRTNVFFSFTCWVRERHGFLA
ncbi:hypothetical protein [Horticoccus sp. 23ND18S-11]|uniref:hypothetical protein n=1 Tax=Horticoccus sp. 23ND18S-11 TaxID=3391832 RepID=UPI0039C9F93A